MPRGPDARMGSKALLAAEALDSCIEAGTPEGMRRLMGAGTGRQNRTSLLVHARHTLIRHCEWAQPLAWPTAKQWFDHAERTIHA